MTMFIRLLGADVAEKAKELKNAIAGAGELFEVEPSSFSQVPGSPFAYWVSSRIRKLFIEFTPFGTADRGARCGMATADDFRWVRLWWEGGQSREGPAYPVSFAKGGAFSPYYADISTTLRWGKDGRWLKAWKTEQLRLGEITANNSKCWNEEVYFRAGLTWPLRTHRFCPQVLPADVVISVRGSGIYCGQETAYFLGLLSSSVVDYLLRMPAGKDAHPQYDMGDINLLPVPEAGPTDKRAITKLARRAWSLMRALYTTNETSHAFVLPSGLNEKATGLNRGAVQRELASIQQQIDANAFVLYGIDPQDRALIETSSKRAAPVDVSLGDSDDEEDEEPAAAQKDALKSWLVGVAFGRFDARLATSERAIPPEPDPFDALPSRSTGMYPESEEASDRPDILVDDDGHRDDLAHRVRAVADRVRVDLPENLRAWLAKEFFSLHIKMYTKSGRKAPIYWQLATPSANYSVWLYLHACSKDTLFRVQNDYIAPKLAHEERRFESLSRELREKATAALRRELAAQEELVEELRALLEEVKRVAPLWNPNLDDGVIINLAPLWRLVPQNKSWQKELKSTWQALSDGKCDWAHLAMHLWPERVIPKCKTDRSLAIAHGLEDLFWVQGNDGKWKPRSAPTRPVDVLVRERTSAAVKASLKSLLDAPVAKGNGGRGRGRRAANASAEVGAR